MGFLVQEEILSVLSLPQSFEGFMITLETRDELPSLSMLKIKLHEEGKRRKVQENQVEKSEQTVFGIRSTDKENTSKQKTVKEQLHAGIVEVVATKLKSARQRKNGKRVREQTRNHILYSTLSLS